MKSIILILFILAFPSLPYIEKYDEYKQNSIVSNTSALQYNVRRNLITENDGYQWYRIKNSRGLYGAENLNGETIIPVRYSLVVYHETDKYFSVRDKQSDYKGIYLTDGKCVISTDQRYDNAYFRRKDGFEYCKVEKNGYVGICDRNGKEMISPDERYVSIIYSSSFLKGRKRSEDSFEYICDADGYRGNSSSNSLSKTEVASIDSKSLSRYSYPCTMAYCLDGTTQDIESREICRQNPTLGYITFFRDKIVVDNSEIYKLKQEKDGVRIYQGSTLNNGYVSAIPLIFVNEDFSDVVLFISAGNKITKSQIYLMEVSDFQALCNDLNNNMNVGQFIDNTSGTSSAVAPSTNRSAGFDSRYDYKDCPSCHGTGVCPTCNGRNLQHNGFGLNDSACANCLRDRDGHRTGKCSSCQGTGKVYGLR